MRVQIRARHGLLVFLLVAAAAPSVGQAASAEVAVFPLPGSSYNLPGTQISFRGIAPGQIGPVQVAGSSSGAHSGRLESDSDGLGASFISDQPFDPGETVTVTTQLDLVGAPNGGYSFTIAHTAGLIPPGNLLLVRARPGGEERFRSRPDLHPPALTVTDDTTPASGGDIFLAPQNGPAQNGPMILDPRGRLVWFWPYPVSRNTLVTDFRVQSLYGEPVLTWWQGNTNLGQGAGEGVVLDRNYQQIATVHAGNGLPMDLHEFLLTPDADAYLVAGSLVRVPGIKQPVLDSVVQEVDLWTGLVLFEWHALDHVPLGDSDFTWRPSQTVVDPYHVNSIALDRAENLIVSMRNTSAVYDIDHRSGRVIWTLGGKHSSFKMGPGTATWGQHDATVQPDGTLTLFDDGAGPPTVHPFSRGIHERLDTGRMTATLVDEYIHSPPLSANFEGSMQQLSDGDVFVGWGQQPYFSEFTPAGKQVFDAHFDLATSSYRAYRFPWSGEPLTLPALAVEPTADGSADVYASWNGATEVTDWQVLSGVSPRALAPSARVPRSGFETQIAVGGSPYFAVQALSSSGQVLATSKPVATPPHLAILASTVLVDARHGEGQIPIGCFAARACRVTLSIWWRRGRIARSSSQLISAGAVADVRFRLSSSPGRARVRLEVRASGMSAAITATLVAGR